MQIVSGLNLDEPPKLWPLGMCVVRILQVYRRGKIVAEGQYNRLGGLEICRMKFQPGVPLQLAIDISGVSLMFGFRWIIQHPGDVWITIEGYTLTGEYELTGIDH